MGTNFSCQSSENIKVLLPHHKTTMVYREARDSVKSLDGFAEFGAGQDQGVVLVVELLVEGIHFEAVLGGPESFSIPTGLLKMFLRTSAAPTL